MPPSERREAARLRSERWRRAHGIDPRARGKAVACGRLFTRAKARQQAALSAAMAARLAMLDRIEWQLANCARISTGPLRRMRR